MARVMSFAMAIFIIIPVLAPAMGQGLLFVGTWRLMFDLLLVAGIIVALWAGLRLPETMRALGAQPLPLACRPAAGARDAADDRLWGERRADVRLRARLR